MKKIIMKSMKTAACVLCIAGICGGCWNSRELNTLSIVIGVGIDKAEGSDKMKITAQIVKPGEIASTSSSGKSGSSEAFYNLKKTGDTAFETIRNMTDEVSRKLFFPHNQVLIFGESLAKEGVHEVVDLFARDPETRNRIFILVAKNSAEEILDTKANLEKIPASKIANLVRLEAITTSQASAVRFTDFATRLMSKTTAPVATMIEVIGEGEEKTATLCGTAVFKEDKLVGELDKVEGRGLLWVLDEVKKGIIVVEGPDGSPASLEIIRSSTKITPQIKDGRVIMKISIVEEGNIGEYTGSDSLSSKDKIAFLENKKTEVIQNEIMAAFAKAKELNADIFGFGDEVHQKYPKEWKNMENNWDEIFQSIELELNIEAELRLMGRINNPTVYKQE